MTVAPFRIRLLIPSLALVVATTMVPDGVRLPSIRYIEYTYSFGDFTNNLILYLPFGFALASWRFRRVLLAGLALSTLAEVLQLGFVHRVPSPLDLATNTVGAIVGYALGRAWFRYFGSYLKSVPFPRILGLVAIPVAIAGCLLMVRHKTATDFSNWNRGFQLVLGNEPTGDRPWSGTVSRVDIYPFAMPSAQIALIERGASTARFYPPVLELNQLHHFTNSGAPLVLSPESAERVYEPVVSRSSMTLLLSMMTDDVNQSGPARILTYSKDAAHRNFTLGQVGPALTFRLRTPASGSNGIDHALLSGPVLIPHRQHFIAVVYDGRVSEMFIDGKEVAHADFASQRPHFPWRVMRLLRGSAVPVRQLELTVSEVVLSALLVLGIVVIAGRPLRRRTLVSIGLLGGAAIGGAIWILGPSEQWLGVGILLECIAAGVCVSASVEHPASLPKEPYAALGTGALVGADTGRAAAMRRPNRIIGRSQR